MRYDFLQLIWGKSSTCPNFMILYPFAIASYNFAVRVVLSVNDWYSIITTHDLTLLRITHSFFAEHTISDYNFG